MTFDEVCAHFATLGQVRPNGHGKALAACPCCGGSTGHLSIKAADSGGVLLACAKCDAKAPAIVEAAGLTMRDIAPPREESNRPRIAATYDYTDADGRPLYQVVRFDPKDFRQRRRDDSQAGGWAWNLKGVPLVLYRLPEVLAAVDRGVRVVIVEGEKDADCLAAHGVVATTACMGAGKWSKGKTAYTEPLRGADVLIIPDRDPDKKEGRPHRAGQLHAADIAESLRDVARSVAVLELRLVNGSERPLKDVSDWYAEGGTTQELLDLADRTAVDGAVYARLQREWQSGSATPTAAESKPATPPLAADALDDEETDERATLRLIARDGHRLRYCAELSRWYVWDGVIWRPDRSLTAESIAREAARAHTTDVVARGADNRRIRSALVMEGRGHVLASLKGAASDPSIAVLPEQLDCEPDTLATPSGWVDLRTGQAITPDSRRLITQVVAAPYDPTATCPRWDRFLAEVATDRADLVEYLRRWVGYCLTGHTKEQCMVVAYGRGANGKGTLWDTLRNHVFGPQYSCEAPPKLLLAQNYDAHPTELMELYRRRLVTASEVPDESRWDESKLKRLTGEDAIKGRYMRADFIEFQPTHKLVAYFNERPEVRDTTQSFWRRMKLVPFDASFLGAAADDSLRSALAKEAPGILAWAVRGAVDWYAHGLPVSRAVSDATQSYRGTEDTVGAWLADFTVDVTAVGFQTSASLFDDFERWCRKNGSDERELSKKAFGKQLRIHGAREARSESARGWDLTGCREALRLTRLTDCSEAETECVRKNANESDALQTPDTSDASRRVRLMHAHDKLPTGRDASDASCVRISPDGYNDDGNPFGIADPEF